MTSTRRRRSTCSSCRASTSSRSLELTPAQDHLWGRILHVAQSIAEDEGIDETGFRLVVNTGVNGGQTVDHLHMHLLGGRRMTWPPG